MDTGGALQQHLEGAAAGRVLLLAACTARQHGCCSQTPPIPLGWVGLVAGAPRLGGLGGRVVPTTHHASAALVGIVVVDGVAVAGHLVSLVPGATLARLLGLAVVANVLGLPV
jgi:hypothetical protein